MMLLGARTAVGSPLSPFSTWLLSLRVSCLLPDKKKGGYQHVHHRPYIAARSLKRGLSFLGALSKDDRVSDQRWGTQQPASVVVSLVTRVRPMPWT